jgi:hypothetical protein
MINSMEKDNILIKMEFLNMEFGVMVRESNGLIPRIKMIYDYFYNFYNKLDMKLMDAFLYLDDPCQSSGCEN